MDPQTQWQNPYDKLAEAKKSGTKADVVRAVIRGGSDSMDLLTWREEVYRELRAIRELLEWDKADTLARRIEMKAEAERDKAEALAMAEAVIEKQKEAARAIYREAQEEHERRWHGRPPSKPEIVQ